MVPSGEPTRARCVEVATGLGRWLLDAKLGNGVLTIGCLVLLAALSEIGGVDFLALLDRGAEYAGLSAPECPEIPTPLETEP